MRRVAKLKLAIIVSVALVLAGTVVEVVAHSLGSSHVFLTIDNQSIVGRFEITFADLNHALEESFRTDGTVTQAELDARVDAIEGYFLQRSRFAPNGIPREARVTGHGLLNLNIAQYAVIEFTLGEFTVRPDHIDVHYSVLFDRVPTHSGLLVIENDWQSGVWNEESNVLLIFGPQNTEQRLDLSGSSKLRGLAAFMKLGTHHIWIGIDHILFLVALLLPGVVRRTDRTWEPVATFKPALIYLIKIVTVFTIAHTITLSLATLQAITISSRLVESIIALSIAVAAFDIVYPIFKQRVWLIVFGFGLFHGFGFASVLGEIGIPQAYMLYSLLGFNIGVELGQLAIVCAVFPLLYWLRSTAFYVRFLLPLGATALIIVSLYWFIERGFEIDLPAGALVQSLFKILT